MKNDNMIKNLIFAMLLIIPLEVVEANEITWTTWPATVYYFAHLSGPGAPYGDVTFHITAIDEYALYVNGNRIDDERNDGNWRTVEEYTFPVNSNDIIISVEVKNHGTGNGNGLMIDIETGSDQFGTTTVRRMAEEHNGSLHLFPVAWYYAGWDITQSPLLGDEWYKLNYNPETGESILTDSDIYPLLPSVLPGEFKEAIDYTLSENTEVVTGYPGDFLFVDNGGTEGGGISLRSIEGENIAHGKPAEVMVLTDGNISDTFYSYTQDPINSTMWIDLEHIYRINEMVLYTGVSDPSNWEKTSVRSWALDISLDKFRWEEVGFIHEVGVSNIDKGGFNYSSITTPLEWARYLRYRISDKSETFPAVGEIMVYGLGYALEGVYESPWLDLGEPDTPKTIETISRDGDVPEGTRISIQTKSFQVQPDGTLSQGHWSAEHTEQSFAFNSPLPVLQIKYRIKLFTEDTYQTPILKSLTISYDSSVNVETDVPEKTAFLGVYPNPFNPETMISFRIGSVSSPQNVQINIYSMNGQNVRTLKNEFLGSGNYRILWDGRDDDGMVLASGLYICRLVVGRALFTNKMLMIR